MALFEKAPNEVTNTPESLLEDGFGKNPIYQILVAEKNQKIVGISLCYYRYSTWKGKCLYLEDLIVTDKERRSGIGSALFDATVKLAKEQQCAFLNWQVLDWNVDAIEFYRKYKADLDDEWVNCKLSIKTN